MRLIWLLPLLLSSTASAQPLIYRDGDRLAVTRSGYWQLGAPRLEGEAWQSSLTTTPTTVSARLDEANTPWWLMVRVEQWPGLLLVRVADTGGRLNLTETYATAADLSRSRTAAADWVRATLARCGSPADLPDAADLRRRLFGIDDPATPDSLDAARAAYARLSSPDWRVREAAEATMHQHKAAVVRLWIDGQLNDPSPEQWRAIQAVVRRRESVAAWRDALMVCFGY